MSASQNSDTMTSPLILAVLPGDSHYSYVSQQLEKIPGANVRLLRIKSMYDDPNDEALGDLSQVEVYFGSMTFFSKIVHRCVNLRWAQSVAAGSDAIWKTLKNKQLKPWFTYTRNAISFSQPMAEYVIGQIIAVHRGFYIMRDQQTQAVWNKSYPLMCSKAIDDVVCILGLGVIGTEVARLCKVFGMEVWGVTRTPVPQDQKKTFVDQYRLMKDIDEVLENSDFIVSLLPSTDETRGILSDRRFSVCRKKPAFINVGRSDVTDEDSILEALRKGWISWAVLDVFDEEPLPASSPLWHEPRVVVTPHISGAISKGDHSVKVYNKLCLSTTGLSGVVIKREIIVTLRESVMFVTNA
ncbi:glyoxylate/hydroxypyruvate reductase A-like [Gigantopelta aegis]|uniref:glyoxylate/hydroxypyruvate reductase A-like n=1 Tax=Gigantopelta aegis TaxID=1735272 RepID=UPI001B889F60|nr:glyoxylate/hydroxypyruvate reductase A-like [Gigantopelta aegis]